MHDFLRNLLDLVDEVSDGQFRVLSIRVLPPLWLSDAGQILVNLLKLLLQPQLFGKLCELEGGVLVIEAMDLTLKVFVLVHDVTLNLRVVSDGRMLRNRVLLLHSLAR